MTYKEITTGKVLCEPLVHIDDFHKYWLGIADEREQIRREDVEWIALGTDY